MKFFLTRIQKCWTTWWLPEIQIQHPLSDTKQFVRLRKGSMSVGADVSNDLILLSENIQRFEGTFVYQHHQVMLLTPQGQKKVVQQTPIGVGDFLCTRVSKIWSMLPFLIGLVGLLVLTMQVFQSAPPPQVTRLAVELPAKGTYGHLIAEQSATLALPFSFHVTEPHAMTLFFSPGNIPKDDTVFVELNGHIVDALPSCVNEWAREVRFAIAPDHLLAGINRLRFVTESELPKPWGVRNVYIQKSQMTDQVDPAKWYRVAQKLYVERNAISGNLLRAKQAMQKSLKAIEQKEQSTPQAYKALYEKIVTEQKQLFETTLRQARLLVRNQDRVRAKIYYQKMLQELIDPMSKNRSMILQEMREAGL